MRRRGETLSVAELALDGFSRRRHNTCCVSEGQYSHWMRQVFGASMGMHYLNLLVSMTGGPEVGDKEFLNPNASCIDEFVV